MDANKSGIPVKVVFVFAQLAVYDGSMRLWGLEIYIYIIRENTISVLSFFFILIIERDAS